MPGPLFGGPPAGPGSSFLFPSRMSWLDSVRLNRAESGAGRMFSAEFSLNCLFLGAGRSFASHCLCYFSLPSITGRVGSPSQECPCSVGRRWGWQTPCSCSLIGGSGGGEAPSACCPFPLGAWQLWPQEGYLGLSLTPSRRLFLIPVLGWGWGGVAQTAFRYL